MRTPIKDQDGFVSERNEDSPLNWATDLKSSEGRPDTSSHFVDRNSDVRLELERILASEFFKGSKRCQAFLSYVVESFCLESTGDLKERTLGIVIFHRAPDYDTGTDAIVRVKASEVRRRLAQYNLTADPKRPVVIELRSGSYVPQITRKPIFEVVQSPPPDKASKSIVQELFFISAITFAVLLFVLVIVAHTVSTSRLPIRKFWGPYVHQKEPIICTAFSSVYTRVPSKIKDTSDAHGAFIIRKQLENFGRSSRIAVASDIDTSDLMASPVILIGGPGVNRWTMSMTKDLRFSFATIDNKRSIVDREDPTRFWQDQAVSQAGEPLEDYLIITRLLRSSFGQAMVSVAGMRAYGSQAGTKLITDPASLQSILMSAPDGWENKNLQLVLRTRITKGVPGTPQLAAATYW
jgi:hypothetical protein